MEGGFESWQCVLDWWWWWKDLLWACLFALFFSLCFERRLIFRWRLLSDSDADEGVEILELLEFCCGCVETNKFLRKADIVSQSGTVCVDRLLTRTKSLQSSETRSRNLHKKLKRNQSHKIENKSISNKYSK